MIPFVWDWLKRNIIFVLVLSAAACLPFAIGEVTRSVNPSSMMPVALSAVGFAWALGASTLNWKQAWVGLIALGIPGVVIFVGGLVHLLGRSLLAFFNFIPQPILWLFKGTKVDTSTLLVTWTEFTGQTSQVLLRLGEFITSIFNGKLVIDSASAILVWNLLLWLVGAWAGWQMRRNRQVLLALAPGGAILALVLDYVHETGLVIVYLALMLILIGLTRNEWVHSGWQMRKVDYSDSITIDTLGMVGVVTVILVLSAAGTPSFSWRDFIEKLNETNQNGDNRVADSLGIEAPTDFEDGERIRQGGLPRQHLLGLAPELSREVVFTVSTGEFPPLPETVEIRPDRNYWRSFTYDVYTGVGWASSSSQDVLLPADTPLIARHENYRVLNQSIYRAPGRNRPLYWSGILASADIDIEVSWRMTPPLNPSPNRNGDMLGALTNYGEYTAVSYLPLFSASQLRAAESQYPAEIIEGYLHLPDSIPERVLALSREVTNYAPTTYDRALAIESYLRSFPYTLEVEAPPPGRDVADYFLFTAQEGFCDYYATSMVVLARAAGLPARLVVGYASGDYNSPTAEYVVRREHAHSWVEIYFPEIGWIEFEPTAGLPAIARPQVLEDASDSNPSLPAELQAPTFLNVDWYDLLSTLGGQFLIVITTLVFLLLLWQMGERAFLQLLPSQQAISMIFSRVGKLSTRLVSDLPNGHTPHQLQNALIDRLKEADNRLARILLAQVEDGIRHVIQLYVAQVFSQHSPTKKHVRVGIRAWFRIRWRLWIGAKIIRMK